MEDVISSHPLKRWKHSRMRSIHSRVERPIGLSDLEKSKKSRSKKENGSKRYEMLKKTDYTDVAYRDAVSRLRYLLNESYSSPPPTKYSVVGYNREGSDEESGASSVATDRTRKTRLISFRRPYLPERLSKNPQQHVSSSSYGRGNDSENANQSSGTPELLAFVERQEEYIDQLEKEAQYCRDELSHLLGKVKELISENESLQEQQKTGLMKVMLEDMNAERDNEFQSPKKYRKHLEGPLIVFESRISELEAQLTQTKIDLRKAQEETEYYKKKLEDSQPSSSNYDFYKQIENLQREKRDLNDSLAKLQASISQIREKEIDASKKVQRTLDVVDKTQFEKQQAEMEVYRLKSELELQHDKLLEVLSEQTRKVADERSQAERRYQQHIERLNGELTIQRDALSKLQMEVEKHQRIEEDLKRDLNSKNLTIENVKKELNNKIANLQKEFSIALTERDSLEQELNSSKMSSERIERLGKQEANRLQAEISSLKKRLDGGDADLIHCRRENLRHMEKISDLEKELTLYKIKLGEQRDPIEDEEQNAKERLMNSRISEIEAKHVEKVSDLEGLIENQSQVMAQLKAECQSLTQKLEESTARHKQEMESLRSRLKTLDNKLDTNISAQKYPSDDVSKEPEILTNKKNEFQTVATEIKLSEAPERENQKQPFLTRESRQNSSSAFDSNHEESQTEGKFKNFQRNNSRNSYNGGIDREAEKINVKQEGDKNNSVDGRSKDYSNHANSDQPFSNYQKPQSSYGQDPSLIRNQHSSSNQEPIYREETSFNEETVSRDRLLQQEKLLLSERSSSREQLPYDHQNFSQMPPFEEKQFLSEQSLNQEQLPLNSSNNHPNFPQQPSLSEKKSYQEQPSYSHANFPQELSLPEKQSYQEQASYNHSNFPQQPPLPEKQSYNKPPLYNHPNSHPDFLQQSSYQEKQSPYQEQLSHNQADSYSAFPQQPSLPEQPPAYSKQPSYNHPNGPADQSPPLERPVHSDQPSVSEQSFHQKQPHPPEQSSYGEQQKPKEKILHPKQVLSQAEPVPEEYSKTNFTVSSQPATSSPAETFQSAPPEPKYSVPETKPSVPETKAPVPEPKFSTLETKPSAHEPKEPEPKPTEAPKTTPSQRFQRAAELSRQSSRSEDSFRGRLPGSQARVKTSQIARNQAKPQSRFK